VEGRQLFTLSPITIDTAVLAASLASASAGALVSFEGRVRNSNEGKEVLALEYEAYEALALSEGTRVLEEALERFPLLAARCVHRIGRLEVGEVAVWVGVIAAHRDAAFAACRYVIDEVKARVPIWKKEHYAAGEAGWIGERVDR